MATSITPPIVIRDVDSVADVMDLISKDFTIADETVRAKILSFDSDDLILVTKTISGALKITDVTKIDDAFFGEYIKTE
ncbi:MAG: hypothetical protein ACREBJ_09300 [Nitrosotalea sp.]